jgi:hypothetical protein
MLIDFEDEGDLSPDETIDESPVVIPSYAVGAASHSIAAGDEDNGSTAGAVVGTGIGLGIALSAPVSIPAGIGITALAGLTGYDWRLSVGAAASGLTQTVDSIAYLASLGNIDRNAREDTSNLLQHLDSNLDEYYQRRADAVDTVGFGLASLPLGLGSINVYNKSAAMLGAATKGKIGSTMANATGLLGDIKQANLLAAENSIKQFGQTWKFTDAKLLKAFGAGVGEQVLQGAAFELGVQAGLNKSPLLENEDLSDILHNTLQGALIGGALGAVFEPFFIASRMKNALAIHDAENINFTFSAGAQPGTPVASRYIINSLEKERIFNENPLNASQNQDAIQTVSSIDDRNRAMLHEFESSDAISVNLVHEKASSMRGSAHEMMLGMEDLSNLNKTTKIESAINAINKKVSNAIELSEDESTLLSKYSTKFIHLWGSNAGNVTTEARTFVSLWDTLKEGQTIKVSGRAVEAGGVKYDFKVNDVWNAKEQLTNHTDVKRFQARELWAMHLDGANLPDVLTVHATDFAMLRKLISEPNDKVRTINLIHNKSKTGVQQLNGSLPDLAPELFKVLETNVNSLGAKTIAKQLKRKVEDNKLSEDVISSAFGVNKEYLTGEAANTNPSKDLFALVTQLDDYKNSVKDIKNADKPENIIYKPQVVKATYNKEVIDSNIVNTAGVETYVKQQQKLLSLSAQRAAATVLGEDATQFISPAEFNTQRANRVGVGSGTALPADASYGSEGSLWQRIGAVTNRLLNTKSREAEARLVGFEAAFSKDPNSTVELSAIINKITESPDHYLLDMDNEGLILKSSKGKIDASSEDFIPINSKLVLSYLRAHIDLNAVRSTKGNTLRSVFQGGDSRDPEVLYFPPPDLSKYPHVAIITDPSITSTGHSKMIYAATQEELQKQISYLNNTEFKAGVIVKPNVTVGADWEKWYKAVGDYKQSETMNSNYFNAALHRTGVASRAILQTDSKVILDDLKAWHIAEERKLVREAVSLKYFKEFEELRNLGERHEAIRTSQPRPGDANQFTSTLSNEKDKIKSALGGDNPYMSYVRLALDLSNYEKIPLRAQQDWLDKQVSQVWDNISRSVKDSKTMEDLKVTTKLLEDAGVKLLSEELYHTGLQNHRLPAGALSNFVRNGNAMIASIALKPSVFNTINNAAGMITNLAPETHAVVNLIKSSNQSKAISELGSLAYLNPGFLSTPKLIWNALKVARSPEFREWSKAKGFSFNTLQEVSSIEDNLALTGTESVQELSSRSSNMYKQTMAFLDKASKLTGNSYVEEMTRAISAATMKQLTDVAVTNGLMSEVVADSYIQTFVNRVNGVYQATQKPMMFNGVAGQAMGLFQTYMVTFYNNMLRNAVNGNYKSLAMMAGLQGTIHGMSTLPGFQVLNSQLVGEFASNTNHKDIYSATYKSVNKDTADWFMFGTLSSVPGLFDPDLKINMYSRGDINPRNVSLVPLNPADYPIVSIGKKVIDTAYRVMSENNNGNEFLSALEHNGVSRELAGMAQVVRGMVNPEHKVYSTSTDGSKALDNDLISLMSLIRIAGARPLDETIVRDKAYRNSVYAAIDSDNIQALGKGIKERVRDGKLADLTRDELIGFQREYIKLGGSARGFNKYWVNLLQSTDMNQVEVLTNKLRLPESQQIQGLLIESSGVN